MTEKKKFPLKQVGAIRPERFTWANDHGLIVEGAKSLDEVEAEKKKRAAAVRAPFQPSGSVADAGKADPSIEDDDIADATSTWDSIMPDYAGLLDAEVVPS